MKKAKDFIDTQHSARWMSKKLHEAFCITPQELLKRSWNKALEEVRENRTAIILMHKRNMVGTIIPSSLKNEFYRKFSSLDDINPIITTSKDDLQTNPDKNIALLNKGINLIITDDNDNELCTIFSREFSVFLEIDKDGKVKIAEHMIEGLNHSEQQSETHLTNLKL